MKKLLSSFFLIVALMTITGCSNSSNDDDKVIVPTQEDVLDETVEITGYLLGAAPAGMDRVLEEINAKMLEDINTTVNIKYISWADFGSKYPLVLAAGDGVDFIFTANWSFYGQEAAKHAFYEITEDAIKEYMPKHYEVLDKAAYDQTKVDGKMYMITTASPDKKIPVAVIRGDLREKYGVPKIENFSEIGAYLEAIKENESSMIPMFLDGSYDIGQPFNALVNENVPSSTDILYSTGAGTGVIFNYQDDNGKLEYMLDGSIYEEMVDAAKIMKEWNDKGYINSDVFSNQVRSKDSFVQGKSAVGFGNSQDMQSVLATAEANGWNAEIIPLTNEGGHYLADPFINNGVAIAASSENPERTMMVLDLLMTDEYYNYLAYFGVEGENYVIKDGKIDLPDGVTPESNTYPPDAAGFWFVNKNLHKPLASWNNAYVDLRDELNNSDILVSHPLSAFSPNVENISTEVANLGQTFVQYLQPMYVGMVEDVDSGFELLDEKLRAAGVETVLDELQTQVDAYMTGLK